MADNLKGLAWLPCVEWAASGHGWKQEPSAVIQRRGNEGLDHVEGVVEVKSGQITGICIIEATGFVNILDVCMKKLDKATGRMNFPLSKMKKPPMGVVGFWGSGGGKTER